MCGFAKLWSRYIYINILGAASEATAGSVLSVSLIYGRVKSLWYTWEPGPYEVFI